MAHYLHHVPGRLRVRSKAFSHESGARSKVLRTIWTTAGVRSVRLNSKAGSVTVCYEVGTIKPEEILNLMHRHECLESRSMPKRTSSSQGALTTEIGKMALGVLVNKGVSYSLSSLLGARI